MFICDKQKIYFAQIVPCRCPKIPDFAQMFETCVAIASYSPDRYGYGHTDLINLVKSISTEKHIVSAKKLFSALKRLHTCFWVSTDLERLGGLIWGKLYNELKNKDLLYSRTIDELFSQKDQ